MPHPSIHPSIRLSFCAVVKFFFFFFFFLPPPLQINLAHKIGGGGALEHFDLNKHTSFHSQTTLMKRLSLPSRASVQSLLSWTCRASLVVLILVVGQDVVPNVNGLNLHHSVKIVDEAAVQQPTSSWLLSSWPKKRQEQCLPCPPATFSNKGNPIPHNPNKPTKRSHSSSSPIR